MKQRVCYIVMIVEGATEKVSHETEADLQQKIVLMNICAFLNLQKG